MCTERKYKLKTYQKLIGLKGKYGNYDIFTSETLVLSPSS